MTYLPSDLLNSNWEYYYNNNYYIIRTNNNCYTNYQTQYCDCYSVFVNNHYLVSKSYSCSSQNSNYRLDFSTFTSDYYYRGDIDSILITFAIIVCFGFGIPLYLLRKFLKVV